jgi:hypothetical protein
MDEPIDPFKGPGRWLADDTLGTSGFANSLHLSDYYPAIFAIVFFIWAAYSLVAAYHWFRYGHRSFLTIPMLAVHVVVSGMLMLIATAGLK